MEINSNYLEKFSKLSKEALSKFTLRGNLLIVEKLTIEKKTKSGIILEAGSHKNAAFGIHENSLDYHIVVAVGEGYEDEEGVSDPSLLECKVGDVVVLPQGAINYIPYFGASTISAEEADKVGLAKSSDCFMVFDGIEGFQQFFKEME